MPIAIDRIVKQFGAFAALKGVSLEAREGEFLALLGPSGSGKTTLLRVIAGLEFPDAGHLRFDGRDVAPLHPRERGIGFVFQHYALFRHMTVFENVAFGLRVKSRPSRPGSGEIHDRVHELLGLVQLEGLAARYPGQLSGGQRQRVALARALAVQPRVLLLDEPFGALDAKVRKELRRWLRDLHDSMGLTSVFVTHDQEEALDLADRVVVMRDGRIEQDGTPREVYERPATPFVFEFLGNSNRLPCRVESGEVKLGDQRYPVPADWSGTDGDAFAYMRPHDVAVEPEDSLGGLSAVVRQVSWVGPLLHVVCALRDGGAIVEAEVPRHVGIASRLASHLPVVLRPRVFTVFGAAA